MEAGLRTGNLQSPYPEEANRKIITQIAKLEFSADQEGCDNLLGEGIDPQKVFMVGNSVIDALLLRSRLSQADSSIATTLENSGFSPIGKISFS